MRTLATVVALSLVCLCAASAEAATAWTQNTQPANPNYTPPANVSNNPAGPINITRNNVGFWTITFNGLAPQAANRNAQVSLAGSGLAAYCRVTRSTVSGANVLVVVSCFDKTGAPKDDNFYLLLETK
jgi:hypothetical protein